jgi:hypothetical protein
MRTVFDTYTPCSERARIMLLAVAALMIMLPSAHIESGILAAPSGPFVPPALDRFLTTVDATIPRHARVVVFTPRGCCLRASSLVHLRALYRLYPRRVYEIFSAPCVHTPDGWVAPAVPWGLIRFFTRQLRARYGLAWGLRLAAPPAVMRLHAAGGTLVEVSPLCPQGTVSVGTHAARRSQAAPPL